MLNWHYVFDTFKFFKLFPFGVRIFVLILAYPGQKFKYDNGAVWGLLQNKRNLINKRKKLGGRGPFQTFLGSFRTRIRMCRFGFGFLGSRSRRVGQVAALPGWPLRPVPDRLGFPGRNYINAYIYWPCALAESPGPTHAKPGGSCFFAPLSVCECGFLGP